MSLYQNLNSTFSHLKLPAGEKIMKMTTEEAFVKVLQAHGIEHSFGIIGSAMMPISDLFADRPHPGLYEIEVGSRADWPGRGIAVS